jgi:hypothetical protein
MTDQCEATHFEDDASLPDKFVTRGELKLKGTSVAGHSIQ